MANPWAGLSGNITSGIGTAISLAQLQDQRAAAARKQALVRADQRARADELVARGKLESANQWALESDLGIQYRQVPGLPNVVAKYDLATGQPIGDLVAVGQRGRVAATARTARQEGVLGMYGVTGGDRLPTAQAPMGPPAPADMALGRLMGQMGGPPPEMTEAELAELARPELPAGGVPGGVLPVPDDPVARMFQSQQAVSPGLAVGSPSALGGPELSAALEPAYFQPATGGPTALEQAEAFLLRTAPPGKEMESMRELNRAREAMTRGMTGAIKDLHEIDHKTKQLKLSERRVAGYEKQVDRSLRRPRGRGGDRRTKRDAWQRYTWSSDKLQRLEKALMTKEEERPKLNRTTGKPILDAQGNPVMEIKTVTPERTEGIKREIEMLRRTRNAAIQLLEPEYRRFLEEDRPAPPPPPPPPTLGEITMVPEQLAEITVGSAGEALSAAGRRDHAERIKDAGERKMAGVRERMDVLRKLATEAEAEADRWRKLEIPGAIAQATNRAEGYRARLKEAERDLEKWKQGIAKGVTDVLQEPTSEKSPKGNEALRGTPPPTSRAGRALRNLQAGRGDWEATLKQATDAERAWLEAHRG